MRNRSLKHFSTEALLAFLLIGNVLLSSCKKESSPCQNKDWFQDADGDGFGNPAVAKSSCERPAGFVSENTDCDDLNRMINPSMEEISGDDIDNNCDGNSLISIGDQYQGGIVFYIDNSGVHGLIASPIDQSADIDWTNDTIDCFVKNTKKDLGYGLQNTEYIVSQFGQGNYAAYLCYTSTVGGYDDWYLPSLNELQLMYVNLHVQGLGNFDKNAYWSSSQEGDYQFHDVYYRDFSLSNQKNGVVSSCYKGTYSIQARAIRKF